MPKKAAPAPLPQLTIDQLISSGALRPGLFDAPATEPPPPKPRTLGDEVVDIGSAFWQGAKSAGRAVSSSAKAVNGDNAGIEADAASALAARQDMPEAHQALTDEIARRRAANPDAPALQAIGDVAGAAAGNLRGTAQLVAEQAPNAAIALGGGWVGARVGGWAGAKVGGAAGAAFGPGGAAIGAGIGFLAGMFLGNAALEIGHKAQEKAQGGLTDEERQASIGEGAVKAGVVTAVDYATLGAGRWVSRALNNPAIRAGARAEAKVLSDAGVDITKAGPIIEALAMNPALRTQAKAAGKAAAKAASSLKSRAGTAGALVAGETVGEYTGEYAGEYAATGKADPYDAALEAIAGFAQSVPEVAWSMSQSAGNGLSADGIAAAAKALAPTPANPAATAAAAKATEPNSPLSKAAVAGVAAQPAQPAVDPATRLAELEVIAKGRPEQKITGPDGRPVTVPAEPGRYFTEAEHQEYQRLKGARDATPGAVKDEIGDQAAAIQEQVRNGGLLETLRAEESPINVKSFLNDLAVAASPSAGAAQREQAMTRLRVAVDWAQQRQALPGLGEGVEIAATEAPAAGPAAAPGAPGAPDVDAVIAALRKPPFTRTAADKVLLDSALRAYGNDGMLALDHAANAPFKLSAEQKSRVASMRSGATQPAPAGVPADRAAGQLPAAEAAGAPAQPAPQSAAAPAEAPAVTAPPGVGPAVFRKRRAQLDQLVRMGFDTVQRRESGVFALVDTKSGKEFVLDGRADAQLARAAIAAHIDAQAHEAAASPQNDLTEPTPAQIEAMNYKKGHIANLNGVRISIENPRGSMRRGVSPDGKAWETQLAHHYGDVEGTRGADGDPVDVFIGPRPDSDKIFVIDQRNADGSFDEHKVMMGFTSEAAARAGYLANYDKGWTGLGAITEMTPAQFRAWVKSPAAKRPAHPDFGKDDDAAADREGSAAERRAGAADAGRGRGGSAAGGRSAERVQGQAEDRRLAPAAGSRVPVGGRTALIVDPAVEAAAALRAVAAAFGQEVAFFADDRHIGDGFVHDLYPGVLFVSTGSVINPLSVLGHEFWHHIEKTEPEIAGAVRRVVADNMRASKERGDRVGYTFNDYTRGAYTKDQQVSELSADLFGNLLKDEQFWADVMAELHRLDGGPGLVARMVAWLNTVTANVKRALRSLPAMDGYDSERFIEDMDEVRGAYTQALAQYLKSNGIRKTAMQAEVLRATQEVKRSAPRLVLTGPDFDSPARHIVSDIAQSTARDSTRTKEFKRWFGASRVTDAFGEPLVVYHGTTKAFDRFDPDADPVTFEKDRGKQFFAESPEDASRYAVGTSEMVGGNPQVLPVYLRIEHPMVVRVDADPDAWWDEQLNNYWDEEVAGRGHDGLIVIGTDAERHGRQRVMFVTGNPRQIKSVFNTGTFSRRDDNLSRSASRDYTPAREARAQLYQRRRQSDADLSASARYHTERLKSDPETIRIEEQRRVDAEWVKTSAKPGHVETVDGVRLREVARRAAPAGRFVSYLTEDGVFDVDHNIDSGEASVSLASDYSEDGDYAGEFDGLKGAAAFLRGDVGPESDGFDDYEPRNYGKAVTKSAARTYTPARDDLDGQGLGRDAGGVAAAARSTDAPAARYGRPQEGSVSATGVHFGREARGTLSAAFYGTGLKGAERARLEGAENADIRPRIFFYVDKGNGVRAEAGVGAYAHRVRLDNLYDVWADPLGLRKANPGANNWERAILRAGFDGYLSLDPQMPQGFAVLVGKQHTGVPVEPADAGQAKAPAAERPAELRRSLLSRELGAIDLGNIPGASLRSGTLVVPEGSREQANAEMARIGSGTRFSAGRDVTETEAFKKWFGDSKAVDKDGRPLVLYHGTEKAGFRAFDPNRAGSNTGRDFEGFYFTGKMGASTYSGTKRDARLATAEEIEDGEHTGPGNYPVYLSMQDPYVVDFNGEGWDAEVDEGAFFGMDEVVRYAKEAGHDGVIAKNIIDEGRHGAGYGWDDTTYVVFEPGQIKSATGNRGTFDATDPDITKSVTRKLERVDPMEVSTRTPSAKPSKKFTPEDSVQNLLIADFNSGLGQESWLAAVAGLVTQYPGYRKTRGANTPELQLERQVRFMTNNLVWLHNQVPKEIRERSKLWYDGARKIAEELSRKYGIEPAQAAGILASLSPQKDWFMNVSLAERVAQIMAERQAFKWSKQMDETASRIFGGAAYQEDVASIRGKTLDALDGEYLRAMWLRVYDEAHNPRSFMIVSPEGDFIAEARTINGELAKPAWGGISTIAKAVSIFEDGSFSNINDRLGRKHKVRNFYNNILVPDSPNGHVTIDTHAVAAALLRALSGDSVEVMHNFGGPKSAYAGLEGTYALYEEAYRRAANQLGLLPRELQSITWEAIRGLYAPSFKSQRKNVDAVDAAWNSYRNGRLSYEDARNKALQLGGGIDAPSWAGRDPGAYVEDEAAADDGNVPGDGVPERGAPADSRASRQRTGAASPAKLSDLTAERIGGLLGKTDWAILTAENPNGNPATDTYNRKATQQLESDLKKGGYKYRKVTGRYGSPKDENSFAVVGIDEQEARDLGKRYAQESVLTRRGLVYWDGSVTPATGVEKFVDRPEDFFSVVDGVAFRIDLDFSQRLQPGDVQAERASGEISAERTPQENAKADYDEELAYAKRVISGDAKVEGFGYYDDYVKTVGDEAELIEPGGKLLFVGSGPMPLSAILFAREGFDVEGLDISPQAKSVGEAVAKAAGVDLKVNIADASTFDFGAYDNIVLALEAGADEALKARILGRIADTAKPGASVLLRGSKGPEFVQVRGALPEGLRPGRAVDTWGGLGETLRTTVLARPGTNKQSGVAATGATYNQADDTAPAANREETAANDRVVELRKRLSVLNSLTKCMG